MIIFLAHAWHPAVAARFARLHRETAGLMPCRLLLQDDGGPVVERWSRYLAERGLADAVTVFDAAALPAELGLEYLEPGSINPGCTHYPLLWLAERFAADYYWSVESDVEYTGSWRDFFGSFARSGADLLAAHPAGYRDNPEWHWWPSLRMPPDTAVDNLSRRQAFFPVYRISAQAVRLVKTRQRQGWRGHYEALLPTLLATEGLEVADLRDIAPDCYLGTTVDPWQPPATWSSVRWRPPISGTEFSIRTLMPRPCLLHPIKEAPDAPPAAAVPTERGTPLISVVLATYHGAAHLDRQLASLEAQTRPPDEVIIVDDASQDGTWDLLVDFGARSRLGVRVHRQPHRVGYVRNFADALGHATGDLLLFCDQDDIWYPDKIEVVESAFAAGDFDVLTHDIRIVDSAGGGPDTVRHDSFFGYLDEAGLPRELCVKGHTQAVRASFLRSWGWPPPEGFSHDVWTALVSTLIGRRGYLDRVLVDHRLHGGNASGWLPSDQDLRVLSRDDLRAGAGPGQVMLDMLIAHDRPARLATLTSALARHPGALSTLSGYASRLEG